MGFTMTSIKGFDPSVRENVINIIADCENWDAYEGINSDGDQVLVFVRKDEFMIVKTRHKSKPKWLECVEYDADGWQVSLTYEYAS